MLKNKYANWYDSIIKRARGRILEGYSEKHHIVPKSLGGSNSDENLVLLTAREHYVCHKLLIRMTDGAERQSMLWAMHMMLYGSKNGRHERHQPCSREYEKFREIFAASLRKPRIITDEHRANLIASNQLRKGRKLSAETKAKMSAAKIGDRNSMAGKSHTVEAKQKMSENRKGKSRSGIPCSEEKKQKIREAVLRAIADKVQSPRTFFAKRIESRRP